MLGGIDARNALKMAGFALTVTPGRSGTKLLARLIAECLDINAEHEAPPRLNYVLRTVQFAPAAARWWLIAEKLPAIAARLDGRPYADISHLYCKGFIEPILEIGLRPDIIILTRPAREVALSMLAIGSIPTRTVSGQLALVGPTDPGVVAPDGWQAWSNYQLCYWYAREIERRQAIYARTLPAAGCRTFHISMAGLTDIKTFLPLARFLTHNPEFQVQPERHAAIVSVNQHPRVGDIAGPLPDAPSDIECSELEGCVDDSLTALGSVAGALENR